MSRKENHNGVSLPKHVDVKLMANVTPEDVQAVLGGTIEQVNGGRSPVTLHCRIDPHRTVDIVFPGTSREPLRVEAYETHDGAQIISSRKFARGAVVLRGESSVEIKTLFERRAEDEATSRYVKRGASVTFVEPGSIPSGITIYKNEEPREFPKDVKKYPDQLLVNAEDIARKKARR